MYFFRWNLCLIFVFLYLVSSSIAFPERPSKKDRQTMFNECLSEIPVNPDIAIEYRAFNLSNEDPNGQCFIKCLCLKEGVCYEDGKINIEMIQGSVPDMAHRMIKENGIMCSAMEGDDDCNTFFVRYKCFNNALPRYLRNMLRDMEQFLL
uniref:CSON001234 protein n=1 Tax=Culicoides sonorensis TaxID=179676 RepID=A0A336LUQ3_CULSO